MSKLFHRFDAKLLNLFSNQAIKVQYYFFLLWTISLFLFGVIQGQTSIFDYLDLTKSRDVLQQATYKLEREVANLQLEIKKINTSKVYARRVLRDRYHMTAPNEYILFFPE